jgi:hypothetical protein
VRAHTGSESRDPLLGNASNAAVDVITSSISTIIDRTCYFLIRVFVHVIKPQFMKFVVFTDRNMNNAVFWNVRPCVFVFELLTLKKVVAPIFRVAESRVYL